MAAQIFVRELFRQRCSVSATGVRGGRSERSYETAWRVWKADGGRPLPFTATEALSAVQAEHPINSTFAGMEGVKLLRLEPSEFAPYVFDVLGGYGVPETPAIPDDFSDFIRQSQQSQSSSNPHGAQLSGDVTTVDEYDYKDLKDDWFVNTAGDPLQELIPIPVVLQVLRVTLNQATLPNVGQVGMANGRKLFAGLRYDAELHVNPFTGVYTPYYRVSYEMWVHSRRDWSPIVVWDAGYNQLAPKVGNDFEWERVPIVNPKTHLPYNTVQFLDGGGFPLAPPKPGGKIKPHPLYFKVREEGQFNIPFLT